MNSRQATLGGWPIGLVCMAILVGVTLDASCATQVRATGSGGELRDAGQGAGVTAGGTAEGGGGTACTPSIVDSGVPGNPYPDHGTRPGCCAPVEHVLCNSNVGVVSEEYGHPEWAKHCAFGSICSDDGYGYACASPADPTQACDEATRVGEDCQYTYPLSCTSTCPLNTICGWKLKPGASGRTLRSKNCYCTPVALNGCDPECLWGLVDHADCCDPANDCTCCDPSTGRNCFPPVSKK